MGQLNNIAACKKYEAKLQMLGKDTNGLFKANKEGIAVELSKLGEALNYPDTLYIPGFASIVERPPFYGMDSVFSNIPSDERTKYHIKKVVFSDSLAVTREILGMISYSYPNIKTINLTEQQYIALEAQYSKESLLKYNFEVRKNQNKS